MNIYVKALYFLLSPMIVNGSFNFLYPLRKIFPFFAKLDYPIDFKRYFFDGRRILGDSTTFPGILVALIVGPTVGLIFYNSIYLGLLIGFSTYLGHALGSFIKRRLGITDGVFLPVIDHGDYVVVNGLLWIYLDLITVKIFIISWILILLIHPVFCLLGFKIGMRDKVF